MQQNETLKSGFDSPPPEKNYRDSLPVPLSALKLDLPFELPEGEPPVGSASRRERPVRHPRLVTTDAATAGLTLPLKARLWLLFGGFLLLFLVSSALAGLVFFELVNTEQHAGALQLRADRGHHLQMGFLGQQGAINRLMVTAQTENYEQLNSFEFNLYSVTFDNNLFLLRQADSSGDIAPFLDDIGSRQLKLYSLYWSIFLELKAQNLARARAIWQESELWTQDLSARLFSLNEKLTAAADTARLELAEIQKRGLLTLSLIGGISAILLALLIWLARRFVFGPMGRLNVKLGQLLYGQTADRKSVV